MVFELLAEYERVSVEASDAVVLFRKWYGYIVPILYDSISFNSVINQREGGLLPSYLVVFSQAVHAFIEHILCPAFFSGSESDLHLYRFADSIFPPLKHWVYFHLRSAVTSHNIWEVLALAFYYILEGFANHPMNILLKPLLKFEHRFNDNVFLKGADKLPPDFVAYELS